MPAPSASRLPSGQAGLWPLVASAVVLVTGSAGCGQGSQGGPGSSGHPMDEPLEPGTQVALSLSDDDAARLSALNEELDALDDLTTAQLLAKREVGHVTELGYDPSTAAGLSLIQGSPLQLDGEEQEILQSKGFVISARQQFPHMLYGYDSIYAADLPVYVSADSILDTVHRSYDTMLSSVEQSVLIGELKALLDGMRERLAAGGYSGQAAEDADFFIAVGKSLLEDRAARPVLGASAADIQRFYAGATAGTGHEQVAIFGAKREIDFSQFTPRGHYTDTEELQHYFRAMMWFGRIELRLIETMPDGTQQFHRGELETALLLRELLDDELFARWTHIDTVIETFVGKSDYMRLPEVDALLADLGARDASGLAELSDQRIAQAIVEGGYGAQLIASQIITNASPDGKTLPLSRSFCFFGQRYAVDSHVFSNVVYDRVAGRLMPSPFDAAYAALGNDQAAALLEPELTSYSYAPALERMRVLIDAHDAEFWDANLYDLWLSSLRALSPDGTTADPTSAGLPMVAGTESWGRRMLNTQLASWAQLRHDTILYVKQSYTSGAVCEFPDAYVDPYPELYAALMRFAERGSMLADVLSGGASADAAQSLRLYFDNLRASMEILRGMAEQERRGEEFTADQLAFINDMVRVSQDGVCGAPPLYTGWYAKLIYGALPYGQVASTFDPTIADVHTQPTDAGGNDVGRILHVGTGYARQLTVTIDTCEGPKAYVGVASSYYEQVTESWKRLTDPEWESEVDTAPDVPWVEDFVAGATPAPSP